MSFKESLCSREGLSNCFKRWSRLTILKRNCWKGCDWGIKGEGRFVCGSSISENILCQRLSWGYRSDGISSSKGLFYCRGNCDEPGISNAADLRKRIYFQLINVSQEPWKEPAWINILELNWIHIISILEMWNRFWLKNLTHLYSPYLEWIWRLNRGYFKVNIVEFWGCWNFNIKRLCRYDLFSRLSFLNADTADIFTFTLIKFIIVTNILLNLSLNHRIIFIGNGRYLRDWSNFRYWWRTRWRTGSCGWCSVVVFDLLTNRDSGFRGCLVRPTTLSSWELQLWKWIWSRLIGFGTFILEFRRGVWLAIRSECSATSRCWLFCCRCLWPVSKTREYIFLYV